MSSFLVLVVKYVGGSLDLLLAPLLILLLNKEVRRGVTLIYRSVRDKGYVRVGQSYSIWIIGWIAPGWFERKGWIHPVLQNRPGQNSYSAARNWITNSSPQTLKRRPLPLLLSLSFFYGSCYFYWQDQEVPTEHHAEQLQHGTLTTAAVLNQLHPPVTIIGA